MERVRGGELEVLRRRAAPAPQESSLRESTPRTGWTKNTQKTVDVSRGRPALLFLGWWWWGFRPFMYDILYKRFKIYLREVWVPPGVSFT